MRPHRLLAGVSLLLTAACPDFLDPRERWERRPSYVIDVMEERVTLPARVAAGQEFQVEFTTYGGGCHRQGGTPVSVSGRTADLNPFDEVNAAAEACTDILTMFSHSAPLRFDQPGTAQVRIHGLRLGNNEPVTITRSVEVTGP